jgi:plastocyanin
MITRTKLSLVLTLTLTGLFVTACNWGAVSGEASQSSAQPLAKAESPVADMNMTAKQPSQMSSKPATPNANEIVIQNFSFEPATLTVNVGTKVTWVNRDDDPHTATATDKQFNSKTLDTGDQFSTQFTKPGTYNYYCALHPKMTGQVIVK